MTGWWVAAWLAGCGPTHDPSVDTPATVDTDDTVDTVVDTPTAQDTDLPAVAGAFALRRLNREEYDRTVADLLSTTHRFGETFPAEPKTGGFNNVAAGLAISPVWFDLADRAAAALAAEATRPPLAAPVEQVIPGDSGAFVCETAPRNVIEGTAFAMHNSGTAFAAVTVPVEGSWQITVTVHATHEHSRPLLWSILLNGAVLYDGQIPTDQTTATVTVAGGFVTGANALGISFNNDYQSAFEDRNLYIDRVTVSGPTDWSPDPTPAYARTMVCDLNTTDPRACARLVLEALVPRAWRRPTTPDEVESLLAVYDAVLALGDTPQSALEAAVQAVLISPHFLLLVEDAATEALTPINDWQLASRLSYFLWGSMPDEALFAEAAAGTLHTDASLDAQVIRMLADPRADALVTSFAAQWLGIDRVAGSVPNPHTHGDWSGAVLLAMQAEMEGFFRTFVGTRPLVELLTAHEPSTDPVLATFLAANLRHDPGTELEVAASGRGGWLTQAGLLTALSHPDRTSPVRRGAWVLGALLCAEPDPPPPGVPPLAPTDGTARDLRAQMEAHRTNPVCASCHDSIDPIGFTMERFDEVGRYSVAEAGGEIDQSGAMPDGTIVNGPLELQAAIAADPEYLRCATTKAFTWAHHRVPTPTDEVWIDVIRDAMVQDGASLQALIQAIVKAPPFRSRQLVTP